MAGSFARLRCCHAYLRSAATHGTRRTSDFPAARRRCDGPPGRVLVVEFRDEVFAGLKSLLEDFGYNVDRATSGAEVGGKLKKGVPELVLVNETMPDESGWLIACKLRFTNHRQPVWLYAAKTPRIRAAWREVCGVDEVVWYDGVLSQLVLRIREHLECSRNVDRDDTDRVDADAA